MTPKVPHTSVLLAETIAALALNNGDIAVDCTVGAGGHTEQMLAAVGKTGTVLGLDRDESALALARVRLSAAVEAGNLKLIKANFSQIGEVLQAEGLTGKVAGVTADIGVSSMHLDQPQRGFSFQGDGPLDMRMDQSQGRTAADILAEDSEISLTELFRDLGEEPKARNIARQIVKVRETSPITTTAQLADLVKAAAQYRTPSKKHPATRVFQALRIAVNDELGELRSMLDGAFSALRPGGRVAVITFHSLEDRIVKNYFLDQTGSRERANVPRDLPIRDEALQRLHQAKGSVVKPFPLVPDEAEIRQNPRARSAKLRVLAKV